VASSQGNTAYEQAEGEGVGKDDPLQHGRTAPLLAAGSSQGADGEMALATAVSKMKAASTPFKM
jgi:hypothetical protein